MEPFYGSIPWDQIRKDAEEAFGIIESNRKKHSGSAYAGGISFRYDWRALLSVIRMRLPPRETLVGPSVQTFTDYWGGKANPAMTSITPPSSFKTDYCSLAGGDEELCSSVLQESSSSSSSSSFTSPPSPSSSSSESTFPPQPSPSSSSSFHPDDDGGCIDDVKDCKRKFYVCRKKKAQNPEKCLSQWKSCVEDRDLEGSTCFPNTFSASFAGCLGA